MLDVFPVFGWGGSDELLESIGKGVSIIEATLIRNRFNRIVRPFPVFNVFHTMMNPFDIDKIYKTNASECIEAF